MPLLVNALQTTYSTLNSSSIVYAQGDSYDGGTITTVDGSGDFTAGVINWGEVSARTKYNLTVNGYAAMSTSNDVRANATSSGNNNEPFIVINVTITENNINWIYVTLEQAQIGTPDNDCKYAMANYTGSVWFDFGASMSGTTDVTRTINLSGSGVTDVVNGKPLQVAVYSTSDKNSGCGIDYFSVLVDYTVAAANTAPVLKKNDTYPDSPLDTDDLKFNITCSDSDDGDTITGYVKIFNGSSSFKNYSGVVSNDTETTLWTVGSGNTSAGEVWNASYWCGDGTENTTKQWDNVTILSTALDNCTEITVINPTSSSLINFPVYLNITYKSGMQADFDDLRFYNGSCDGNGGQLYAELESKSDGVNANVWVKTNLSTGNNTVAMYFDNDYVGNVWDGAGNVWDNYVLVSHNNDSTGVDSSSIGNDGIVDATIAGGIIGNGYDYDGSSDETAYSANDAYNMTAYNATIEMWVYDRDDDGENEILGGIMYGAGYIMALHQGFGNDVGFLVYGTSGNQKANPAGTLGAGSWFYAVGTYNHNGTINYFHDGAIAATINLSENLRENTPYTFYSGASYSGSNRFNGTIDEVRMSNVLRSADWINMTYQLIANHNTFVVYDTGGAEAPADSCTYSGSGDWLIKASDNCNITSNVDVNGDIIVNETGRLTISAVINFDTNRRLIQFPGIMTIITSGGAIT